MTLLQRLRCKHQPQPQPPEIGSVSKRLAVMLDRARNEARRILAEENIPWK